MQPAYEFHWMSQQRFHVACSVQQECCIGTALLGVMNGSLEDCQIRSAAGTPCHLHRNGVPSGKHTERFITYS